MCQQISLTFVYCCQVIHSCRTVCCGTQIAGNNWLDLLYSTSRIYLWPGAFTRATLATKRRHSDNGIFYEARNNGQANSLRWESHLVFIWWTLCACRHVVCITIKYSWNEKSDYIVYSRLWECTVVSALNYSVELQFFYQLPNVAAIKYHECLRWVKIPFRRPQPNLLSFGWDH